MPLWAGFLGQRINVAVPVALVTTTQKGHAFRWGWWPEGLVGLIVSRCYYSVTNPFWCPVMTATTTLKLPEKLKTRIARLAKETGRSAHSLMIEALEREVAREERMREFVREALVSDAAVEEGAAVYRAEDVHPWLERLAKNRKASRPKPRRK